MSTKTPYQILGIMMDASESEIKAAYFAQVRQFPPERHPQQFKEIQTAYDCLRKPQQRMKTDFSLFRPTVELSETFWQQSFDVAVHREDLLRLAFELLLSPVPSREGKELG